MSLSFHKVTSKITQVTKSSQVRTKPSVDSNNAKSSFVRVGENQWYYYDQYGQKVKGEKVIDGKAYYFLENGLQARDSLVKGSDGYTYYYDKMV